MDDFSEPSLSLPDPATAFLSPIRPSSQHTPPESSTSPQCAPPSRLLREVTPVNDTPTSWADGDAAGSREVLTGTPVCKGSDGSGGSSSSGMSSSRMSDYGAVKGILRPQGTPGSGNGGQSLHSCQHPCISGCRHESDPGANGFIWMLMLTSQSALAKRIASG
jgi:hypothetical protein